MMSRIRTAAVLAALLGVLSIATPAVMAQSESDNPGPIRLLLRERFLRRQQSQTAPQTSGDVHAKITSPGDYVYTIEFGGQARRYRVHVPPKYSPATPTALLLSYHGGGASMDYQASDENYGQISKSDREGFIVVFPNGYSKLPSGKLATWNAGSCCAWARDANIDDVGFTRQIIENLSAQLNIDPKRIFATGISNGGMMAYRVACELGGIIKAVASVAGTIGVTQCHPKEPVAILHFHAKNDDHVLFYGGAGPKAQDKSKVPSFVSVPDNMSRWVGINHCEPTPRRVLEKPGAYCDRYSGCLGNADVELCVTDVGGHSWPGAKKSRGEPTSKAISANDLMWDFFNGR
jgi:polyhydroxybutyrate depolymerase